MRRTTFFLILLFGLHLFFRLYGLETRHQFTWDQIDNAWAAKSIIDDNRLPLVGMIAKQNTGFYIGPLYYYYAALFYLVTNLDPFASVLISGATSIIVFVIFCMLIMKLFSIEVAFVTLFIYSVSVFTIYSDRMQWPVSFIPAVSLLIFYCLYQVLIGREKFILWLVVCLGLSWQLNFTSVFFFIITLFAMPFFPRTKKMVQYALFSLFILFLFFLPNIIYDVQHNQVTSRSLSLYLSEYYHGFHLRRVLQLAPDAFIEFASLFPYRYLSELRYFFLPVFLFLFLKDRIGRDTVLFSYLVVLWFVVPWLVFATYRREISDYYFALTRPVTLFSAAYILVWLMKKNQLVLTMLVMGLLGAYAFLNSHAFFQPVHRPLSVIRQEAMQRIQRGEKIEFSMSDPASYFYYIVAERDNTRTDHL